MNTGEFILSFWFIVLTIVPVAALENSVQADSEDLAVLNSSESYISFQPLFKMVKKGEGVKVNVLGPVLAVQDHQDSFYCRFLLFYWSQKRDQASWGALPFIYSAPRNLVIFPLYGKLRHFLSYNKIDFIMLPFYYFSERFGKKEYSCFWPFVAWANSSNSHSLRIFPFYMQKEMNGRMVNYSYLWPFVNIAISEDSQNPGYGWHVWPFVGHLESRYQKRWTTLWPLFEWKKSLLPKAKKEVYDIFWPCFQYEKNLATNQIDKLYLGPFWGRKKTEYSQMNYYLWPFCILEESNKNEKKTASIKVFPFYGETNVKNENGANACWRYCWPFFSRYAERGNCEIRILDLLPIREVPLVDDFIKPFRSILRIGSGKEWYGFEALWGLFEWWENDDGKGKMDISCLYQVKYGLNEQKISKSSAKVSTSRQFLFGLLKQNVYVNNNMDWTLFWCLTF